LAYTAALPWFQKSGGGGGGDYMKLYEMGMEPERRPFLERLFAFLEEKGSPISNMPVISKQPIDLYRLYLIVQEKGGMVEVRGNLWGSLYRLELGPFIGLGPYSLRNLSKKILSCRWVYYVTLERANSSE